MVLVGSGRAAGFVSLDAPSLPLSASATKRGFEGPKEAHINSAVESWAGAHAMNAREFWPEISLHAFHTYSEESLHTPAAYQRG